MKKSASPIWKKRHLGEDAANISKTQPNTEMLQADDNRNCFPLEFWTVF